MRRHTIPDPDPRHDRFLHRRRRLRPSSAHSDAAPSPARAEPHDAAAWLPLPEPDTLPTIEHLLAGDTAATTAPREVPATPSPARAEPHDETAWLPLPEFDDLPEIHELLTPAPTTEVAPPRTVPVSVPSPARAEPHDPAAWLPLPDLDGVPPEAEGAGSRRRRARRLPHVPVRTMLVALIVAAVLGGVGYGASRLVDAGDDVDLRVDGRVISAETGVSTVGAFLAEEKVNLGEHDRVSPGVDSPIENQMIVKVVRAFPVVVDFDGNTSKVFTTRSEPSAFLADSYPGEAVAIRNPPKHITSNSVVRVRTTKSGVLGVDGQLVKYQHDPAHSVQELLDDLNVKLGPQDVTSPVGVNEVLPDNEAIAVRRIAGRQRVAIEPYSVPDQRLPDPKLDVGKTRIQEAVPGSQTVTYSQVFNNNVMVDETAVSKVPLVAAQPHITFYGTRADPRWEKIAECETGGNWAARGPTYQGGLGIFYKNWLHYRDKDMPKNAGDATREQQIVVAIRIMHEHGWRAWGCGETLGYSGRT